ncbi:hypothetical protein BD413DRAFT_91070 [Trametes elegans]|nr:hypothetical protein BD413DRAFT_91070 [Trametes elegans]
MKKACAITTTIQARGCCGRGGGRAASACARLYVRRSWSRRQPCMGIVRTRHHNLEFVHRSLLSVQRLRNTAHTAVTISRKHPHTTSLPRHAEYSGMNHSRAACTSIVSLPGRRPCRLPRTPGALAPTNGRHTALTGHAQYGHAPSAQSRPSEGPAVHGLSRASPLLGGEKCSGGGGPWRAEGGSRAAHSLLYTRDGPR